MVDLERLSRAERIEELQALVDEAEALQPIPRGIPHLIVGSWLALVAHFLLIGGVTVGDTVGSGLLGVLAALGWGVLLVGGARFLRARLRLRSLRRDLHDLLGRPREAGEAELPSGTEESLTTDLRRDD